MYSGLERYSYVQQLIITHHWVFPFQRQRKLEQQKLSKDFQKVIGEFQRAQRLSASKQREYVDKAKATTAMLQSQSGQPLYVVQLPDFEISFFLHINAFLDT